MAERKVLNKYYPPDFDPSKLPRNKRKVFENVRNMLPMSIRCKSCGNYIYQGTKFNCRKECVAGEDYLGIQKFRFRFKCTLCSAELAIKTDPQNSDYTVEFGATRNYDNEEEAEIRNRKRDRDEIADAMGLLEKKAASSKREMDVLAALEETKSVKSRHANVSVDAMLEDLRRRSDAEKVKLEEEDEALVKSIVFGKSEGFVRRIRDDEEFGFDSHWGEIGRYCERRWLLSQGCG